jgi:hypothetical protein
MRSIHVDSLIGVAMSSLLGTEAISVQEQLGPALIAQINTDLLLLLANVDNAELTVVPAAMGQAQETVLPNWLQPKDGIRFIQLQEGSPELALEILGAAFAWYRYTQSGEAWEFAEPVFKAAYVLWSNIITLKSPKDDGAISIARCLASAGAKRTLFAKPSIDVSTVELASQSKLSLEATVASLKQLHELRVVESSGSQAVDDYTNPDNRWRISL